MRVFITGGSSYLGQHLVPLVPAGQTVTHTFFSNDLLGGGIQLDIRDKVSVERVLGGFRPDVIIHLAGSNRPAGSMDSVIRQGTQNIVEQAQRLNVRLVHLSTDVVFNGRQPPYKEDDKLIPVNNYGRAKVFAESLVREHPNHVIIRTSLIYSLRLMDRGTEWMTKALQDKQPVTLFTNQYRNPAWADSLSRACLELASHDFRGALHVAGAQRLSRANFALKMLDWWGVTERETLQFGLGDPDRWPVDCTLDIGQATSLLKTPLLGVDNVFALTNPK